MMRDRHIYVNGRTSHVNSRHPPYMKIAKSCS
jgi:hypothetical protein